MFRPWYQGIRKDSSTWNLGKCKICWYAAWLEITTILNLCYKFLNRLKFQWTDVIVYIIFMSFWEFISGWIEKNTHILHREWYLKLTLYIPLKKKPDYSPFEKRWTYCFVSCPYKTKCCLLHIFLPLWLLPNFAPKKYQILSPKVDPGPVPGVHSLVWNIFWICFCKVWLHNMHII